MKESLFILIGEIMALSYVRTSIFKESWNLRVLSKSKQTSFVVSERSPVVFTPQCYSVILMGMLCDLQQVTFPPSPVFCCCNMKELQLVVNLKDLYRYNIKLCMACLPIYLYLFLLLPPLFLCKYFLTFGLAIMRLAGSAVLLLPCF